MDTDSNNGDQVTLEVDATGKPRPMPTMGAVKGMDYIEIGEIMEIIFDDPLCVQDLKNWASLKKQEFLGSQQIGTTYSVRIRRLS
ncbi:MAG: sulfurtransferase TusA family protein [Sulfobacillus sp.]